MTADPDCLTPRISESTCRMIFARLSWWRAFWRRKWERGRCELLYLPAYQVDMDPLTFLVDGQKGEWCYLAPKQLSYAAGGSLAVGFRIEAEAAREAALHTVKSLVLYRAFDKRTLPQGAETRVRAAGYPLWMQYLKRDRRYDVFVADGLRGDWADSRLRRSLLLGLAWNAERP